MRALIHSLVLLMVALPLASATAAPVGYSVNSDQPLGDTLHQIDLADGTATAIGVGVSSLGVTRTDVEGLAISPDLALWGVDEDRLKLFRISTTTGAVIPESEVDVSGLDASIFNDFGLTFTCDGALYATSVTSQSLYILDTDGTATRVGAAGSLGVNISAIASVGESPARLFGLGNGLLGDEGPADNRSLYEIDPLTGIATLIGDVGTGVADYTQAGLSFDASGQLWAITDRSIFGQPSQILSLNLGTGEATLESTTTIIGFESLAIAPPGGCVSGPPAEPGPAPEQIPSLSAAGKLLAMLVLLLPGLAGLRLRRS
jgi:hypothetical protein